MLVNKICCSLHWPIILSFEWYKHAGLSFLVSSNDTIWRYGPLSTIAIFLEFNLWWPQMTNDLHQRLKSNLSHNIKKIYVRVLKSIHHCYLEITCSQAVNKMFVVEPLVTTNGHFDASKTIRYSLVIWKHHIPSMKSVHRLYLEIS